MLSAADLLAFEGNVDVLLFGAISLYSRALRAPPTKP